MRTQTNYRVNASKPKGRTNRKLSPTRRRFQEIRGRLVDLGLYPRTMARWVLSSFTVRGRDVWTVSELNSGLRVSMGSTPDDAVYEALKSLYLNGPSATQRAIRRGVHRSGRANAWRKAWRS